MRSLSTKVIAMLILIMLMGLVATEPVIAANVQISGTVTTQSGFGVASAAVEIIDGSNTTVASTIADINGRYAIPVASGSYSIRATPPAGSNYQTATLSGQTFAADTIANISLAPVSGTVVLTGHVFDGQGGAAAQQAVDLRLASGGTTPNILTDTDGRYAFQVTAGSYSVEVHVGGGSIPLPTLPDIYTVTTTSFAVSQATTLDISLPLKRVAVHVQDPNGTAIPGARVTTNSPNLANVSLGSITSAIISNWYNTGVLTNATGDATLWLFPNPGATSNFGMYTLTATPPNGSIYATTPLSGVVVAGDMTVAIVLARPLAISGTVRDGLGNPLANQEVDLRTANGTGANVPTDASGRYTVYAASGTYSLEVHASGNVSPPATVPDTYSLTTTPFTLAQDMTLDVSLPLKQVVVRVQGPDGVAAPGARVTTACPAISDVSLGAITATTVLCRYDTGVLSDGSGNATLWLFPTTENSSDSNARYTITAAPADGSPYTTTSLPGVAVTGDASVTLTLVRPVTLSGTLRDGTGNVTANQAVDLRFPTGVTPSVSTDVSGHYAIRVAPGTYNVEVHTPSVIAPSPSLPESYSVTTAPIAIAQDTTLDLTLPLKHVTVHIEDANAVPVPGTSVATNCPTIPSVSLGTISATTVLCRYSGVTADGSGNASLWLFPNVDATTDLGKYSLTATPPAGSNNPVSALSGLVVTGDMTETLVLQAGVQQGAANGGTTADFVGTDFQPGTQVFFDGVAATNVSIASGAATSRSPRLSEASTLTRLTAIPPAHIPGKVDVKIVNPDGLTMTVQGGYEYVAIAAAPTGRAGSSGSSGPAAPAPNVRPGPSTSGVSPSSAPPHR